MAKADGLLPKFLHFQTKIKYTEDHDIEVQLENVTDYDWVEVVRCKDCRYDHACLTQQFVEENSKIPFNRDEFFCPDGKRRREDDG